MKRYNFIIFAWATSLFLTACSEKELGEPAKLPDDVEIPQGLASAGVDARIVDLYDQYGSYFLYDYTEKEALWNLVNPGTSTRYDISPPKLEYIDDQLNLFQELFLDFYPKEFLRKTLPYKIYLAEKVEKMTWQNVEVYTEFYGNSIFLGYADERAASLPPQSKYKGFREVNEGFINWQFSRGNFSIPEGFDALTDYSIVLSYPNDYYAYPEECHIEGVEKPDEVHLQAGFLNANSQYWGYSQKVSTDLTNYLYFMLYFASESEEWQRLLSYPKVKAKYDFIRNHWVKTYGYDPTTPGNADFGL